MNLIRANQALQRLSDEQILGFLEEEHLNLCSDFHIEITQPTIDMVDGQRMYDLPATTQVVNSAVYYESATNFYSLEGFDYASEFNMQPEQGYTYESAPTRFFVRNGQIGLVNTPDTSTASGYPILKLDVTVATPLVTGNMIDLDKEIPKAVRSPMVYVFGATRRALQLLSMQAVGEELELANARIQVATANYEQVLGEMEIYLSKINRQYKPRVAVHRNDFFPGTI